MIPSVIRADDGIQTYTVPKEQPAVPAQAASAAPAGDSTMPAADIPVNSEKVTWTTPSTWKQLPATSIRIGNFSIPGQDGAKAEAAIFSFPGSVGTELDNVNRWRNELKLPPIDEPQITSSPVTVDGSQGRLYQFVGGKEGILVASVPREGASWFFKIKGDKDVVTDAEPVFRDFLKTVRFSAGGGQAAHAASIFASSGDNPHGDLNGVRLPPDSASAEPKWTIPSEWKETSPGPMIFRSFSASNDGKNAEITVSDFPGDVGGTFANVNRWRRQMSLAPVEEDKLATVTAPINTTAGPATLVDFTGTDAKTSQSARLVAIIVPHNGSTWFYKLLGDGDLVNAQKNNFVKFVQTVQYP